MDRKTREKKRREEVDVAGQLANAPAKGKKGGYIRLPEKMQFFNPKADQVYRLIFLPWRAGSGNNTGAKGKLVVVRYLKTHRDLGPNQDQCLCLAPMGEPCVVCDEYAAKRQESGQDKVKYKAIAAPLKQKDREMYLIHDLDGPKNNVQVWEEATFLFGKYFREKLERRTEYKKYANYDGGLVVEIKGVTQPMGEGGGTCVHFSGIEIYERDQDLDLEPVFDRSEKLCPDDWVIKTSESRLLKMLGYEAPDDTDDPDSGGEYNQNGDGEEQEEEQDEEPAEEAEEQTQDEDEEIIGDDEPEEPEPDDPPPTRTRAAAPAAPAPRAPARPNPAPARPASAPRAPAAPARPAPRRQPGK